MHEKSRDSRLLSVRAAKALPIFLTHAYTEAIRYGSMPVSYNPATYIPAFSKTVRRKMRNTMHKFSSLHPNLSRALIVPSLRRSPDRQIDPFM